MMLLVLVVLLLLLLLLVDEMLLLLLGGHRQQPLPVVANDLPLVLRVLVRRPSHVAVAQSRWRRRMARTAAAAAVVVMIVVVLVRMLLLLLAVVVVVLVVAAATVTLILDLGEEKVLLVAVLLRFARAEMCVSYVGRNLRTGRVGDTTTLPGAFVDRLAGSLAGSAGSLSLSLATSSGQAIPLSPSVRAASSGPDRQLVPVILERQ